MTPRISGLIQVQVRMSITPNTGETHVFVGQP